MARTRNIKPGFFENDELAALGPYAQILFAGLWTIADREGRLQDRPARIKHATLPYYDCEIDVLLAGLDEAGFILRYEVAGVRFIQVLNWHKHQQPHVKEAQSSIPVPGTKEAKSHLSLVQAPVKHGASTVPEPDETATSTVKESPHPSSLNIDSLNPPYTPPTGGEPSDNFTEFADYVWSTWPDRKGKKLYKGKALDQLKKIAARDWDAVALGVENFAASAQALKGMAPDLFRWLRDAGWKDWQEPERVLNGKGSAPALDPKKYTEGKYAGIFKPKEPAKGVGDAPY